MSEALAAYLAEVARGLGGVARLRRRTFLRELESHLLDEAEARGIADEAGMRAMLAEKEPGGLLGREISDKEDDGLRHAWPSTPPPAPAEGRGQPGASRWTTTGLTGSGRCSLRWRWSG